MDYNRFMKGISAIMLVFMLVLSSILITDTNTVSGEPFGSSGVTERTGNGSHNITLFLHNVSDSEASKTIPGNGSTWNWFDTEAEFNKVNTTLTATGTNNRFDWYLYPALADKVTTSSVSLKIWAKAGMGSSQNANIQVEIYERDSTGTEAIVGSNNVGSQTFPAVGTLWTWTVNFATPHNFSKGSSIKVRLIANPGTSKTVYFYYDSLKANSRVIIPTADHIMVDDIKTKDSSGEDRLNFDAIADNKTIDIRALIKDPFGGYDIKWVNVSVSYLNGSSIIEKVGMKKISGTPISRISQYRYLLNYSSLPSGKYNITIWALDNSGYNYCNHFQMYTYGEYPVTGKGFFYIGKMPYYVWVQVKDDKGENLTGSLVEAISGSVTVDSIITDENGTGNLTLFPGKYYFHVYWQGVVVNRYYYNVSMNVSSSNPVVINASVYFPTMRVIDNSTLPIHKAAIYLTHPNGTKFDPIQTDQSGNVSLSRFPEGSYNAVVRWRGVVINKSTIYINSSGLYEIRGSVYYLSILTSDMSGSIMTNIGISAFENETGLILDFKLTGTNGEATLRVPMTRLDLVAYWFNRPVNRTYDLAITGDIKLNMTCHVFSNPVRVMDSHGEPVGNALVTFRTYPGGDILSSTKTDESGYTEAKMIEGIFELEVIWYDMVVNRTLINITGQGAIPVYTDIYYVNFTVLDSSGDPVSEAEIKMRSPKGTIIATISTDVNGSVEVRLPIGENLIDVFWKTVHVNSSSIQVVKDTKWTINLSLHQITFSVLDSHELPLSNAGVRVFLNDTGDMIISGITDEHGMVVLRVPTTPVDISVLWKDRDVHRESQLIFDESTAWTIIAEVYHINFTVLDSKDMPVQNAVIIVKDSENENVLDSDTTDQNGSVIIRLPATDVDISVFWRNALVYLERGYAVIGDDDKLISSAVFYVTFLAQDSIFVTVSDATVVAFDEEGGDPIATGVTDPEGHTTMRLTIGTFYLETRWNTVVVNRTEIDVFENIEEFQLHLDIYYVDFHIIDSRDEPLSGSTLYVHKNGNGRILGSGIADGNGDLTLRLPGTSVELTVYWDEVQVYYESGYMVNANTERDIEARVYYMEVHTVDKTQASVADSRIYLITNNTSIKYRDITDSEGMTTFRLPAQSYDMEIYWKNVMVYEDSFTIDQDMESTSVLNIYQVTYFAVDSRSNPVFSAQVVVFNNQTGEMINTGITSLDGSKTMRVPGISVDIFAYTMGIGIYEEYDCLVNENINKTLECDIFYISFLALDSADVPIMNATISAFNPITGGSLDYGSTDADGLVTLRLPGTTVDVKAEWLQRPIFSGEMDIIGDMSPDDPVVLDCTVYYVNAEVIDSDEIPVMDAHITIFNTGLVIESVITDEKGAQTLRLPAGTYPLTINWNGVEVFSSEVKVSGDDDWTLEVAIFHLDITVLDADDIPVEKAQVTAFNLDYTSIGSTSATDNQGGTHFRLSVGRYRISVRWKDKPTAMIEEMDLNSSEDITINAYIYYLTVVATSKKGDPIPDVEIHVYDEDMIINSGILTDENGTAVFRLPKDDYLIDAYLKKTENFKRLEFTENESLTLDSSKELEIEFGDYPPSFFSTPLFYATLLPILILLIIIGIMVYFLFSRSGETAPPPEQEEEFQGEEEIEEEEEIEDTDEYDETEGNELDMLEPDENDQGVPAMEEVLEEK